MPPGSRAPAGSGGSQKYPRHPRRYGAGYLTSCGRLILDLTGGVEMQTRRPGVTHLQPISPSGILSPNSAFLARLRKIPQQHYSGRNEGGSAARNHKRDRCGDAAVELVVGGDPAAVLETHPLG